MISIRRGLIVVWGHESSVIPHLSKLRYAVKEQPDWWGECAKFLEI